MTLALAGLAVVALAWLIQLIRTWNNKGLSRSFILLYGIGIALTVAAYAQAGFTTEAWLNVLLLLIIALMYMKVHD